MDRRLNLVRDLRHHKVGNEHLWVAPRYGFFLALSKEEHRAFRLLVSGLAPAEVLVRLAGRNDEDDLTVSWNLIRELITKAAHWGFVQCVNGAVYRYSLRPERYARVHITKRCQLRCIHCYSESSPDCIEDDELPTERWKALIRDFARNGGEYLLLTGGEPLLRKDVAQLLRCAKEAGLSTRVLTNGLLVPKYLTVLAETAEGVQVSLGSPEEESNDRIRGRGTYRRIVRALDLLVQTPVRVQVGITAMASNWRAIEEGLPGFAARYSGTGLRFHVGMGICHHGRGLRLADTLDTERIRFRLLALVDEVNHVTPGKVFSETPSCGYCEQLVVGHDGGIYPCHLLEGRLGHVGDMPLDRWFARIRAVARRHQVGSLEPCKTCDIRRACGGTCRVTNKLFNGTRFRATCSRKDQLRRRANLVHWMSS